MKIGVMCSGNGSNFENIIERCPHHQVVLMVYNRKDCGAKKRADRLGVPSCYIKSNDEDKIIKEFKNAGVDYVVMAGWMRVVTSKLINAFPNKNINIHPSLLPKYKGLNAVQQALDNGDEITGCSVHRVTEDLDSGEVLMQALVPIEENDTVETLTERIHEEEHRILPTVINVQLLLEEVKHVKY